MGILHTYTDLTAWLSIYIVESIYWSPCLGLSLSSNHLPTPQDCNAPSGLLTRPASLHFNVQVAANIIFENSNPTMSLTYPTGGKMQWFLKTWRSKVRDLSTSPAYPWVLPPTSPFCILWGCLQVLCSCHTCTLRCFPPLLYQPGKRCSGASKY